MKRKLKMYTSRNEVSFPDIIGLNWDLVRIKDYNPAWPDIYEKESEFLLTCLNPWLIETEHVGSTAVPGMPGKPVIDIVGIISSKAKFDENLLSIMNTGYRYFGECGRNGRFFCSYSIGMRTIFHLHLVERDHPFRTKLIDFRNKLNSDKVLAKSYMNHKLKLEKMKCDRTNYRKMKEIWFNEM